MAVAELRMSSSDCACLSGDLINDTVVTVIEPGKNLLQKAGDRWTVDMAGVDRVSSAGVALLLEWLRAANAAKVEFKIVNLPEHMRPIIEISDLEPLFESVLN